jgi:uncharacterized protein YkwD
MPKSGIWLLTMLAGLTLSAVHAEAAPPAAGHHPQDGRAAEQGQQLDKLSSVFRRLRADPKRRAEAIRQLAAAGPEGIATAKDLIEKELGRMAAGVDGPSPSGALDEKIAQLRKVLAELRADAALTKEKIEQVGLPALNGLTVLYQQRQSQLLRHRAKFARVQQQLQQFAELLRLLEAEWKGTQAPLPVQDYLQQTDQLLGKIVDPEQENAERIMAENAQLAGRLDPKVVEGMQGLNHLRIVCGLSPLAVDLKLCQAAAEHSADMQSHKFFSHESPLPGKRTFQDRAQKVGTTASGENIYVGSVSASSAGKTWFLSPGHHKNMLNQQHHRQGLGRSGQYWTHLFGSWGPPSSGIHKAATAGRAPHKAATAGRARRDTLSLFMVVPWRDQRSRLYEQRAGCATRVTNCSAAVSTRKIRGPQIERLPAGRDSQGDLLVGEPALAADGQEHRACHYMFSELVEADLKGRLAEKLKKQ